MRNHRPAIVGCDLDGVIADIVRQLVRFSRREHGILLAKESIISEDVEMCTPLRRDQLHKLFQNSRFFQTLSIIRGAREALMKLRMAGCPIHIITDRFWYRDIQTDTRDWLVRNCIPFDSIVFAGKAEKHDTASRLKLDWFIEDQLSNAILLSSVCRVLLIDRPYNQGNTPEAVTRVDSIGVAAKMITDSFRLHGHTQLKQGGIFATP